MKPSTGPGTRKRFLVAGHIAKDVHIRIDNCGKLPKAFAKLFKNSLPISQITGVLGEHWTFDEMVRILREQTVAPISWSYGGRAPNVAYGAALLGAEVELVGFVGEDFDRLYAGFYDGGYRTHLTNAGVAISELRMCPDDISTIHEETHDHGIIVVEQKELPTVFCIKDSEGTDFYLIDDMRGAHTLAGKCPVPKKLLERSDGLFVTSGEHSFNKRLIDYARKLGKQVIFDVGAYDLTRDYLQEIIPQCNVILGNLYELALVKEAFNIDRVERLFDLSSNVSMVMEEDKISCTTTIYHQIGGPVTVGPIDVKKRVSSVGCCDGMAAGYLGLSTQGYDVFTAVRAGLILCASIWEVEGVQEGMLKMRELLLRLKRTRIPIKRKL